MIPDRNKTLSTRKTTASVVSWLDNQGFKPIETETLLCEGWQADVAAILDPTSGESVTLHLAPKKPKWKLWDSDPVLANQMHEAHEAAYKALPPL